jgi:hypothetical protein
MLSMNNHSPLSRHFGELEKYRRISKSLLANRSPIWRVNKLLVLVFRSIAPLWRVNGAIMKVKKENFYYRANLARL